MSGIMTENLAIFSKDTAEDGGNSATQIFSLVGRIHIDYALY